MDNTYYSMHLSVFTFFKYIYFLLTMEFSSKFSFTCRLYVVFIILKHTQYLCFISYNHFGHNYVHTAVAIYFQGNTKVKRGFKALL